MPASLAYSFGGTRSENPTPLCFHLPSPPRSSFQFHRTAGEFPAGMAGMDPGWAAPTQLCAIPPLQQLQENHSESGCTLSRLISRANKGKRRYTGTKPRPWNIGRSSEGAKVTPLPAGNSIPCYSPAWDLPFLSDPFTTSIPWKLAERQEAWRTLAWRKIPQKEFLYRSKFNKTTTNCLL